MGVTLEGTLILTRKKTNARFYGSSVTAHDLLEGSVRPPAQAEPFYRMLNIKFGHLGTGFINASSALPSTINTPASAHIPHPASTSAVAPLVPPRRIK